MWDFKNKVNKNRRYSKGKFAWFEKKSTVIVFSSIMSIGLLTTALTASTILISNIHSTPPLSDGSKPLPPSTNNLPDTLKLLNETNNKVSRLNVWNKYINYLTTMKPQTTSNKTNEFNNIIISNTFIDEFISFLTSNLNIGAATTNGMISQAHVDLIKTTLSNEINKPLFKISTLAKYTNLFTFSEVNTVMFRFMDNATIPTIDFSLSLPIANLDIFYNDNGTVSLKTAANNTQVKLTINKFNALAITTTTNIYFKSDSIFELPTTITNELANYLDGPRGIIKLEEQYRKTLINNFESIQTKINSDETNATSLSYWNTFALNYATANTKFIINDLSKSYYVGGIYTFLLTNANGLPIGDLDQLHYVASDSANVKINPQPFISSEAYSDNSLFVTDKQWIASYSVILNITKFNYNFDVPNFFTGNPIAIVPMLTLSGMLKRVATDSWTTTHDINLAEYNVSAMIDMSETTGFYGFIFDLINPNNSNSSNALFTNGIVNLNSQPIDNQIKFWNNFNKNIDNKAIIFNEITKQDVLYDFIMSNIDINNLNGYGKFPTIVLDTLRASINAIVLGISFSTTSLEIFTGNSESIVLENIQWGPNINDKFSSVKIYFGNESNSSISNFNATSTFDGSISKISLSQKIGETSFANLGSVVAAGSKRISIVFRTLNSQAHIFYFGQKLDKAKQIATPIVIPNTIITNSTNFVDLIKAVK